MNFEEIVKDIATDSGISYEAVMADMQATIDETMKNAAPEAQAMWRKIVEKDDHLTPSEFVYCILKWLAKG